LGSKILYVDMDNVLVDFKSGIERVSEDMLARYEGDYDEIPGIFALMDPVEGAVDAYRKLSACYDTYILSTSPWENPSAWMDKLNWVKKHLEGRIGDPAYKRLILSHNKHLNKGDYLIDDRPCANGADRFEGEMIHFTSEQYPDWDAVLAYLIP
jgi:5'-nucleotidase